MVDKIDKTLKGWKPSKMSTQGKVMMINSSLMAMHVYNLFVYPVSDSILDKFFACARKFLWANCSNSSSIPLINWQKTMLDKTDRGMGIRNLRAAKISLIFKNVLNYLNHKDVFWVHLLFHKYG